MENTSSPSKRHPSKPLFEDITYHIASSIPPQRSLELEAALQTYGAQKSNGLEDPDLNLVIADGPRWEGWNIVQERVELKEEDTSRRKVEVVTGLWVERCILHNRIQSPGFYSTDPSRIFSGVVACATGLDPTDVEVLSGAITAFGGQWRMGLTKDVTHLFATSAGTDKYATALHYQKDTRVIVLLPHWFDDSLRMGTGALPTGDYEWPDPRILRYGEDAGSPVKKESDTDRDQAAIKRNMFATAAFMTPAMGSSSPPPSGDISMVSKRPYLLTSSQITLNGSAVPYTLPQVWGGRRFVLSRTLKLYHGRRTAVEVSIERAGGVVIKFDGDEDEEEDEEEYKYMEGEEEKTKKRLSRNERRRRRAEAQATQDCDILVTRWRYGRAYVQAVRMHKMIGTLAWVYHVQSTGILASPVNQLLHYPVPKRTIEGFSNHVITVTNYTGEAREYLKKLINVMGATFTASMSGQNTALIAASTSGTKAEKAHSWSIAVVNHLWLEDCFVQWRNLTPALERYITFPRHIDFSAMLGQRGVWVGLGGENSLGPPGDSVQGSQVEHRVRDRLEQEAEEIADEDEIFSDLEGDEREQASVEELLAPVPGEEAVPTATIAGKEEDVQGHVGMDLDVDPPLDEWEMPVFDEEMRDEPQRTPTPKPRSKPKSTSAAKKTNGTANVPTSSKTPKSPHKQLALPAKGTKKGGRVAVSEDEEMEVLELEDSSDEENARQRASSSKRAAKAPAAAPPKVSPKRVTGKGKNKRTQSEVTSPSVASGGDDEVEDIREEPAKLTPKTRALFVYAELEEEDDDEDPPSSIIPRKATASKDMSKGRNQLPPSSLEEDEEAEEEEKMNIDEASPTPPPAPPKKTKAQAPVPVKKGPQPKKVQKKAQQSSDDSDSAIIIPERKARPAKPATPIAGPSTPAEVDKALVKSVGGLMNRVKADARTRVRKKKVVEVEAAAQSEVEAEEEVVAVNKKKSAAKPVVEMKANRSAKATSKGKKAALPLSEPEEEAEEEAEEEEEDEEPVPRTSKPAPASSKGKRKTAAAPEPKPRKKPLKVYSASLSAESEDDDDDSPPPSPRRESIKAGKRDTAKGKAKASASAPKADPAPKDVKKNGKAAASTSVKSKSKKEADPSETESDTEDEDEEAIIISKPRGKNTAKTKTATNGGQKDVAPPTAPKTPKRVMSVLMPSLNLSSGKGKSKADEKTKTRAPALSEEDDEPVSFRTKGKSATTKAPTKAPTKAAPKAVAAPAPISKTKPKSKRAPSPSSYNETAGRTEDTDDEEEVNVLVSPRTRAVARTESIRATAGHVLVASGSKGAPPSTAQSKGKTTSRPAPMDVDQPSQGPSSAPRRSAAAKATQRLHDTIMPDLLTFEEQMRKTSKARRSSGRVGVEAFVVKGAEADDGYSRKRSSPHDDDEQEEDGRKKKRRVSDNGNGVDVKPAKAPAKDKAAQMDVDQEALSGVKIMTTQVTLGDDVIKALRKYGATFTTRANECTHLLARQVVRTEKFLCALTSAQWILSEKWAMASFEAKRLLPEKQFVLKDKEGEKKYGIDLAQSLLRAKENHGKMLEGHTFYVTPKVAVDTKLLKNVVNACGGVVSSQTPTIRIISASPQTRHVISTTEDRSIWRPLRIMGIKIYTQELLLTGILKQEMEWDEEDFMVQM